MTAKKKNDESITESEKKYPLERLRAHSHELFGVPSSTFAGAISNVPDGIYSISEIKEIIENWKKKEAR